jgi:transposase-like protein
MTKTADLTNPIFTNEDAAWAHYEATVWPEGPICPHCGVVNEAVRVEAKKTTRKRKNPDGTVRQVETWSRRGLHRCKACGDQFTATVGTVFEDSHIPMHKWLLATHLMAASKMGMPALQLQRMLGLGSYRSAWFMAMRIREAMDDKGVTGPLGGEGKIVEADETYYGKSNTAERLPNRNKPSTAKQQPRKDKRMSRPVVALVERGGKARAVHVGNATKEVVAKFVTENVDPASRLNTDESRLYTGADAHTATHETVKHSAGEYVRGDTHTNSVEGFFGGFKRSMRVYTHCDEKYLGRYVKEAEFRFNTRTKLGFSDKERAALTVKGTVGKRLTLRQPKSL